MQWYARLAAMGAATAEAGSGDGGVEEPAPALPPHAAAAARLAALLTRAERLSQ